MYPFSSNCIIVTGAFLPKRADMSEPTVDFTLKSQSVRFSIPAELIRKNFKLTQKLIEKLKKQTADAIASIKVDLNIKPENKLLQVRRLIRNVEAFQKRLSQAAERDQDYRSRLKTRVDHIYQLKNYTIIGKDHDAEEVLDLHQDGLIEWYRQETDLLVVDYLIKSNTSKKGNTGIELMKQLDRSNTTPLEPLIDVEVYESFNRVFISITNDHELEHVSAWFNENKVALKRVNSNLEFEIHMCRFLSMMENNEVYAAIAYCKAHLAIYSDRSHYSEADMANYENNLKRLTRIGSPLLFYAIPVSQTDDRRLKGTEKSAWNGLLNTYLPKSSSVLFGNYGLALKSERWGELSRCFINDFTKIYNIPKSYPLLVHLSAGLSSLKTKSCYCDAENTVFEGNKKQRIFPMHLDSNLLRNLALRGPNQYYKLLKKTNQCPVCSPELFRLSENLPFTQLVTSIFENPFKLPNGNIYHFDKLLNPSYNEELLIRSGKIKDPLTQEIFFIDDCVRVFPA